MYYTILGRIEKKQSWQGRTEAVIYQYHSTVVHQCLYDVTDFLDIAQKVCKGIQNALTVQLFEGVVINRSQERIVLGANFFLEPEQSAVTQGIHLRPNDDLEFEVLV